MHRASLVPHRVKNLPAIQETWVQSLDQEDLLEEEMATHSSVLAWRIPWTEKPGGPQSVGTQSDTTEQLTLSTLFSLMEYLPHIVSSNTDPITISCVGLLYSHVLLKDI